VKIEVAANFEFILDNFSFEKSEDQDKQGFVLEGGSGSAKTYDIIQFLIYYCQKNKGRGKDILIARKTYADLKKTVLKDFIKILKMYKMYNIKDHVKSHPQAYNLHGNIIYFTGLDGMGSHGERHDIIWCNEVIEINFDDFKQLNQRCNEAFFIDFNPSVTAHWVFDSIIPREDTKHFKSNQLMNPFLPKGQRKEILAYEPYLPGSYEIVNNSICYKGEEVSKTNMPPSHPKNIDQGTADEYMWKVYGLGLRGAMKGVIFHSVKYIDKFPDLAFTYGLDFGFTVDPTALVKYAEEGNNIYLELLSYVPTETPQEISEFMEKIGVTKGLPITADSADKYTGENKGTVEMVGGLIALGWSVRKVSKTNSIMFWLGSMKKKRIHIIKSNLWQKAKIEQENYKMKEIHGIAINQPIDKFNHFWDAARYAHMSYNENTSLW